MENLHGKWAVVTGASSGLGSAIAKAFAEHGARVIGVARRFAGGDPSAKIGPGELGFVGLDVRDERAVVELFARIERVDVLVNNAGNALFRPILDTTGEQMRALVDTHIVGSFLCAREALRRMKPQQSGHIVNVSSIAAFDTFVGSAGYTAAKEGLRGLTRVLTEEARADGVRVTGLYPGAIDTPLWDDKPGFARARMLAPERIASLIVDVVRRPELSVEEIKVRPPGGNL